MKFSEMPYCRVEQAEMEHSFEEILQRAQNAASGEELFAVHQQYYDWDEDIRTNMQLAMIRHSMDTTDEFYEKENDYYDHLTPIYQNCVNRYQKVLYDSPFHDFMEKKIGPVAFKNMEVHFRSFDEKLIPLMQEENALVTKYENLIASAKIPFRGEVYNLALMRPFTTNIDRQTRKEAWKAVSDYFLTVTDEISEIYDRMVKNRTQQAREMGYRNYVELGYYRMGRNCYDREMVENFRRQVKESFVPFVRKIQEQRRKRLGLDALKYYDNGVYFKDGNPPLNGNAEEVMRKGLEMYRELSAETGEFMTEMIQNGLFDITPRKTKQQGGYMTYLPKYHAPFIFGTFTGTSDDISLITHECGHAFQGYCVRNAAIREVQDIGMETAEVHSMSMEYFTYRWMDKFFGDHAADYRTLHFEDSVIFIPYGCMVDEFQHIVYENPEMTKEQRKQVWMDLEKAYRPDLDYDDDPFFARGGYWQRQSHIFCDPFYYIDYVLASVCAMQFKVRMDRDFDDTWKDYLKLCKLSAGDFFTGLCHRVNLRTPFEDGCIEELVGNLEKILRKN